MPARSHGRTTGRTPGRASARTRPRAAVAALTVPCLLGGGVAGCSESPSSAASSAPPALSRAQAEQVLASYTAAADGAGQKLDRRALTAIQSDPQLTMDAAMFSKYRALEQRPPKLDFAKSTFLIPRMEGHPRWFVVGAGGGKGAGARPHAMLFTQERAGGPWLLAADPAPGDGALGRVKLDDDGFAERVAPDAGGLPVPPAQVPKAHAALMTDGPDASGAAALADGPTTGRAYDALQKVTKSLAGQGVRLASTFAPAEYRVHALRTKDGGALVWYAMKQHEAYSAAKRGSLAVSGDLVGLAPARSVRTKLRTTVLTQYLAVIPPDGRAMVAGIYRKAVAAKGA
ncbi:hypothetical protein [Actinomadura sp. WMMB 499]|uniref:hypothetical protein n=1 Tax=Actinomadura sp. WMMB 499 TaxID=1219491 RepID=UPI0012442BD0|nr:hypothetical protein [Actinomadura sp. WMMB 499]QFG24045.1 hypothetical protein F7P10_25895 [Actinomadura sp. WMMB 499]